MLKKGTFFGDEERKRDPDVFDEIIARNRIERAKPMKTMQNDPLESIDRLNRLGPYNENSPYDDMSGQ